jgi:tRNA(Arg) A34 adenosine deaminase TadA
MKYKPEKKFMLVAIEEAKKSAKKGEYAIGAVVVRNNKIIAKSGQRRFRDKTPTAHAECLAISKACKKLKSIFIKDCILYSTHEPCCICTGAAAWARMKGIVYGVNIKDMIKLAKKRGTPSRSFYTPCSEILKYEKPKTIFLVKEFMRKECLKLFDIYPKPESTSKFGR